MSWTGPFDSIVGLVHGVPQRIRATATSTVQAVGPSIRAGESWEAEPAPDEPLGAIEGPSFEPLEIDPDDPFVNTTFRTREGGDGLRIPRELPDVLEGLRPVSTAPLRMYHVLFDELLSVVGPVEYAAPASAAALPPDDVNLIGFIESDEDGDFVIDPASTLPQYFFTSVPTVREVEGWLVETVTDFAPVDLPVIVPGATGRIVPYTRQSYEDLVVLYKDPHVIEVPPVLGGGWLMLMGRVRVIRGVAEDYATAQPDVSDDALSGARAIEASPSRRNIADIVALWCADQLFREETLQGPFLVVDSLRGIGTNEARIRAWLGAPTGAFRIGDDGEWELHVYYNAEVAYSEAGTFDEAADELESYSNMIGFTGGIGHVRIDGGAVADALAGPSVPEADWTQADAWAGVPSGERLNVVKPWMADWTGISVQSSLKDAVMGAVDLSGGLFNPETLDPDFADPAVVAPDEDLLVMVLTVGTTNYSPGVGFNLELTTGGDTLFGLWRLAALERGESLPDGEVSEHGLDFIVSFGVTSSTDLIAPSYRGFDSVGTPIPYQTVDADPVRYRGRWRVYGREEYGSGDDVQFDHEYYVASDTDFSRRVLS